jgi:Family of unknown function (DUF6533)
MWAPELVVISDVHSTYKVIIIHRKHIPSVLTLNYYSVSVVLAGKFTAESWETPQTDFISGYDYSLTFAGKVELVWSRKINFLAVVFYVNRYIDITFDIAGKLSVSSLYLGVISSNAPPSPAEKICKGLFYVRSCKCQLYFPLLRLFTEFNRRSLYWCQCRR